MINPVLFRSWSRFGVKDLTIRLVALARIKSAALFGYVLFL